MLDPLLYNLVPHIILFQAVVLLIVLSNTWIMRRTRQHPPLTIFPKLSILIPARNEEKNIARCVRSLLAQDYPAFEVLVLDDQSTDATYAILQEIASRQAGLKILSGSLLPEGWMGKNWACTQLSRQAQGDLYFFTDADTVFQPHALRAIVTAFSGEQADLLTGFPHQDLHTWGERLIVPFFSWASYCFTPLALAYRLKLPALAFAVGQMLLFRREAYEAIGGHERIGSSIVEDLDLARQITAAGLRWRVTEVADLITTRMYTSSRAAFEGFSKNFFAAFHFRVLPFLLAYGCLAVVFWAPLTLLILTCFNLIPTLPIDIAEAVFCIVLSLLLWLIPYYYLRVPLPLALLYPLTLWVVFAVGCNSLVDSLTGRLHWKDRHLSRPRWRWL